MKGKLFIIMALMFFIALSINSFALENEVYYNNFTVEADFNNDWFAGGCKVMSRNWQSKPKAIWDSAKVGTSDSTEKWAYHNLTSDLQLNNSEWEIILNNYPTGQVGSSSPDTDWTGIQISNGTHGFASFINFGHKSSQQNRSIIYQSNVSNLSQVISIIDYHNSYFTQTPDFLIYGQWQNKTIYIMNSSRSILTTTDSANYTINKIDCIAVAARWKSFVEYVNITTSEYTAPSGNMTLFNVYPIDNYNTINPTINFNFSVNSSTNFTCNLIINDSINLSQDLTEQCYQETPNVATSCGGLDGGTYWWTGNAAFPTRYWDGNFGTFATFYSSASYYSNYSKPLNAVSARWKVRDTTGTTTMNIPAACFNAYPSVIKLLGAVGNGDAEWYCYNGAGYTKLRDVPGNYLYEEAIIWNLTLTDYNFNVSFEQTFSPGIYNWQVNCTNEFNETESTPIRTFLVDPTDPVVITNFINKSVYYKDNLTAQFNFTDNIILYSYNISIDNIKISNKSNIGSSFYQYNLSYNVSNLLGNKHSLFIRLADGHTAKQLKNESGWDIKQPITKDYIRFDWDGGYNKGYVKIKEENFNVLDSWEYEKEDDRYSFEYKPFSAQKEHTFEIESNFPIVIIDAPETKYKKWLIVDDHWLDFYSESSKNDIEIVRDKNKVKVTLKNLDDKQESIKFNSIGDLNIITINYTFTTIDVYDNFEPVIINNISTTLNLTFQGINTTGGNVILEWNNTNYTSSLVFQNSTHARYSKTIKDKREFLNYQYINHTWYFNLTNDEKTNVSQQLEYNVELGECYKGDNNTNIIINISYYDEIGGELINVTNNYDLIFYDGYFYYTLTGTFENNLTDLFCTNIDPGNVTYTWDYWNIYSLTKTGYVSKVIDIEESFPYTCSNNPYQNLSLYMINISESSTITFTWLTTNYQPIDGTMLIYRGNPDGTRSLIESTPIISAEASGNIELLSGIYSYEVISDGKKYSNFDGYTKCHIESSTTRQFFVDIGEITINKLIGLAATPCTLSKIGNNTVNMTWGDNQEDSNTTLQGCILAYRTSFMGSTLIFENCSVTPQNLINSIPLNDYSYNVRGKLIQGDNQYFCTQQVTFDRTETRDINFAQVTLFGIFLLIFTVGMLYAGQPILMLIAATSGLVGAFIFGAFVFNSLMPILSIVIFIGIIITIGRYTQK